ncbi:hypothetical protein [Methanorbis furvi]|uniref:Type II toxin-antitoxin system RelE/ParE family toxin n=1 Tax=Methanorbis furvi TaxID=3028299 RepID=A0AAE4S8Y3_9EURY|nr:hypothetical protein [Methanocorpusculaceae archaeon Ag1]
MTFTICVSNIVQGELEKLSQTDYDFCIKKIRRALEEKPYPGHGGDKEKLAENKYRLHISRTYTALYRINEEKKIVRVYLFGTIGKMHKRYDD